MTYNIEKNADFGSLEVYFSDKPSQMVRDALKLLRFRWHSVKKCWYGFADENKLRETLCTASADQNDIIVTDGYLGATAVYGTKSNRHLYGSDLSAAIRQEFKAAGLKGVSVKCNSYSGGQHLTVTVKTTGADFLSRDEYVHRYQINPGAVWISTAEQPYGIHIDSYFAMDAVQQETFRREAAEYAYDIAITGSHDINQYHIDKYTEYTAGMLEKLHEINRIVCAYRHDDSNSQVDYFDTNFYYTIRVKPANA